MSRTTANAIIDGTAAILFLGMIATGYVLRFPLPPRTNKLYTLWGLTRHEWGAIHFWISVGLLGVLLVHVIIHWQWVVNVVGKRLKLVKSPHASLTKSGVAASLIVTAVLVLFAAAAHWSIEEIPSRRPGRSAPADGRPAPTGGAGSTATRTAQTDLLGEFVRALFDQQCLSCHGPERQLGGFRIDRRDDVLGTGERTPWVVPGDDANSPLLSIVSGARPDMRMAHRHTLSDENVALVRAWIKAGARWPALPEER